MLAFVMLPARVKSLVGVLLGLVLACAAFLWMGAMNPGASVLGIPLGGYKPPVSAGDWSAELKHQAAEHNLTDWQVAYGTDAVGYTMQPRQCYYRATLQGERSGEPVTVEVELLSADRGQWRLSKWSER